MNDAAADEQATEQSAAGAPGNPGDQVGGVQGVQPTRGGGDAAAPGTPASELRRPPVPRWGRR